MGGNRVQKSTTLLSLCMIPTLLTVYLRTFPLQRTLSFTLSSTEEGEEKDTRPGRSEWHSDKSIEGVAYHSLFKMSFAWLYGSTYRVCTEDSVPQTQTHFRTSLDLSAVELIMPAPGGGGEGRDDACQGGEGEREGVSTSDSLDLR